MPAWRWPTTHAATRLRTRPTTRTPESIVSDPRATLKRDEDVRAARGRRPAPRVARSPARVVVVVIARIRESTCLSHLLGDEQHRLVPGHPREAATSPSVGPRRLSSPRDGPRGILGRRRRLRRQRRRRCRPGSGERVAPTPGRRSRPLLPLRAVQGGGHALLGRPVLLGQRQAPPHRRRVHDPRNHRHLRRVQLSRKRLLQLNRGEEPGGL